MGKIDKLILPAAIIIASIVLGGFYASQLIKQRPLNSCMHTADIIYSDTWTYECARLGRCTKEEMAETHLTCKCELPADVSAVIGNARVENKAECFKRYQQ